MQYAYDYGPDPAYPAHASKRYQQEQSSDFPGVTPRSKEYSSEEGLQD